MKYSATVQRQLLLFMAFLVLIISILNWHISIMNWLSLAGFILCLLMAFGKYTLRINKQTISYAIQLFGLTIYRKEIVSSDIKKIMFKRIGWKSKLAAIQVHKGLPIRVALFKPENVHDDLIGFCEENAVHYEKTKDYQIIEKMG